ncbi:hypothetical protein NE237_030143 [Protea cynaroides]|uniref:Protein kinase domain-containing protein n=1 Tax=Protea cynaroides TaxID=273540 RepID=A0A9Q0JVH3_9MAGN|nr:hypothetical protein NE237_030143 [Protea cynaroides]
MVSFNDKGMGKIAGYSSCLSWAVRMKIAIGAAKGLAFLHEADRPIIYRDFKAPNILLDADYTAKLSDFGLAKDGPVGDNTHVTTRVMGTHGYAAPEYVMTGHLTAMSDVYSFGVVLLEILTGRRSTDKNRSMREQNLVDWAKPYINDIQKVDRLMDPRLDGMYSTKGAQMAAQLASQCLRDNPKSRPSMSAAVKTLEFVQGFNDVPVGQFEYTVPQSLTRDKKETEATKHEQVKNTEGTESPKVHDDDEKNKKEKSEHKHRRSPGHRHRSTISPVNSETSLQKYFAKAMNSPKHYNGVTKEEVFQDEF